MAFLNKNFQQILNNLIQHLSSSSNVTDFNVGSVIRTMYESVGLVVDEAYFQIVNVLNAAYLNTCSGADLDRKASDFGLQRKLALQANALVTFSGSGSPTIPQGTIVSTTASGSTSAVSFITTAAGTLNTPIAAICQIAGSVGNVASSSINVIVNNPNPTLITGVTNTQPSTDGLDQEADNTFRARIQAYLLSLSKGTSNSIVSACLNVSNVLVAKVLQKFALSGYILSVSPSLNVVDLNNGAVLSPTTYLSNSNYGDVPASIVVVIDNGSGSLDQGTVTNVQSILLGDINNPITNPGFVGAGIQCFTTRPLNETVDVSFTINTSSTILDTATLETNISNSITTFIEQAQIGGEIFLSDIVDVTMNIAGVTNVVLSSIMLNGNNSDLASSTPASKFIVGTITITVA